MPAASGWSCCSGASGPPGALGAQSWPPPQTPLPSPSPRPGLGLSNKPGPAVRAHGRPGEASAPRRPSGVLRTERLWAGVGRGGRPDGVWPPRPAQAECSANPGGRRGPPARGPGGKGAGPPEGHKEGVGGGVLTQAWSPPPRPPAGPTPHTLVRAANPAEMGEPGAQAVPQSWEWGLQSHPQGHPISILATPATQPRVAWVPWSPTCFPEGALKVWRETRQQVAGRFAAAAAGAIPGGGGPVSWGRGVLGPRGDGQAPDRTSQQRDSQQRDSQQVTSGHQASHPPRLWLPALCGNEKRARPPRGWVSSGPLCPPHPPEDGAVHQGPSRLLAPQEGNCSPWFALNGLGLGTSPAWRTLGVAPAAEVASMGAPLL